jgi:hypothetical protein
MQVDGRERESFVPVENMDELHSSLVRVDFIFVLLSCIVIYQNREGERERKRG